MNGLERKEQLFGTQAIDAVGKYDGVKSFITLQSIKFWIVAYVVSIILYQFFNFPQILPLFVNLINLINIILFPFSILLVGKVVQALQKPIPFAHAILYPSYKTNLKSSHLLIKLFVLLIKVVIYIFIWNYTFIIGTIGLIMALDDVKKLSK